MNGKPFWSPQDEAEYFRQELLKVKEQRNSAFKTGFDAGAIWGISHGLNKVAEIFDATANMWPDFPPELVKAFAGAMVNSIPVISASLTDGLKEARQQAESAQKAGV